MDQRQRAGKCVGVGLDPASTLHPAFEQKGSVCETFVSWAMEVIAATKEHAGFYKINPAFWHAVLGGEALKAILRISSALRSEGIPVILDGKYGDVGHTMEAWIRWIDRTEAEAVTANPLGDLTPLLRHTTVFVWAYSSSPDSMLRASLASEITRMLPAWQQQGPCGLVVGENAPPEVFKGICEQTPAGTHVLAPGIGPQGGSVRSVHFVASRAITNTDGLSGEILGGILRIMESRAKSLNDKVYATICAKV